MNIVFDVNIDVGNDEIKPYFIALDNFTVNSLVEVDGKMKEQEDQFLDKLEKLPTKNTGARYVSANSATINFGESKPLTGGTYVELPKEIQAKKAVVNVKNTDNLCFVWSILASQHPSQHSDRVSNYRPHLNTLKIDGFNFPLKVTDVSKFETLNELVVDVYLLDKEVMPLYISKRKGNRIQLLLYEGHYCLIKDLNRLLNTSGEGRKFCPRCLYGFYGDKRGNGKTAQQLLDDHMGRDECDAVLTQMPAEDSVVCFKEYGRMMKHPYVVYADFESITEKRDCLDGEKGESWTNQIQHHKGVAVGAAFVKNGVLEEFKIRVGETAAKQFLELVRLWAVESIDGLRSNKPMKLTPEEWRQLKTSENCHICNKLLGSDRVADHDHLTGAFRGAAHDECNKKFYIKRFLPVFFHNLKGYDSHLLLKEIDVEQGEELKCIPMSMEKFMSFSWTFKMKKSVWNKETKLYEDKDIPYEVRFLDSAQFMPSALDTLAGNLTKDEKSICASRYQGAQLEEIITKGVFPYDWFDSLEKLNSQQLPPIEAFHSALSGTACSMTQYERAQAVWSLFECKSFEDYMKVYLTADVLLLADVFENFRTTSMAQYGLDPVHYYSAPMLAWDAALKKTGAQPALVSDPDMYQFLENGKRGGISMISHRHAVVENSESEKILYVDANNLYGWAMVQDLPYDSYEWVDVGYDAKRYGKGRGCFVEVDLEYPAAIHDLHNDYPLAVEKRSVNSKELSAYQKSFGLKSSGNGKLIPNLHDKVGYVCYYKNLEFYLAHGLKLKKVGRVLEFAEKPWLQEYIEFNNTQRKAAKNEFEKDFFKLMNNAVFGKTMENVRGREKVELVADPAKMVKIVAKPNYGRSMIIQEQSATHDGLVAVHKKQTKVTLNKPIAVGCAILELSKIHMARFHYDTMKPLFRDGLKLLFTDTDSFCYKISDSRVDEKLLSIKNQLDTSEYEKSHPLYSEENKNVLGMFKDETHGVPITEFVGLRAKMYAYKTFEKEAARAKGITKVYRKGLKVDDYKRVLFHGESTFALQHSIRSFQHNLATIRFNKKALCAYDDKRWLADDGVSSLAYGHYKLKQT